ncbi:MAG: hypothetical protein ISQ13_00005 [Candidatus Margulisbacteria bacterium]|nr:hypothetical protein [Candidatus Margulisiibacteriota bacterium]
MVNNIWSFVNGTNRDIEHNPDGHSIDSSTKEAPSSNSPPSRRYAASNLIGLKRLYKKANSELNSTNDRVSADVRTARDKIKNLNEYKAWLERVETDIRSLNLSHANRQQVEKLEHQKTIIISDLHKLSVDAARIKSKIEGGKGRMAILEQDISKIKKEIEDLEQQRREAGLPVVM